MTISRFMQWPTAQFVGDAHAAVHLDGLAADQPARLADHHLQRDEVALGLGGCSSPAEHTARYSSERVCSSALNMSTSRCCSTWKLPMVTPNCLRVFT